MLPVMNDAADRPARRRWWVRLAIRLGLLGLASVLALVVCEWTIRATDLWGVSYHTDVARYFSESIVLPPEIAHPEGHLFEHRPDVRSEFATFRWRTDERGLRRPEDSEPRVDAAKRVLFLGDSVTLAWGVDAEASWIRGVERTLDRELEGGVRCFNAGHLRYDTVQEAGYFAAHGAALAPDLVVLTFVTNDLEDSWEVYQSMIAQLSAPAPGAMVAAQARLMTWFHGTRSAWQVVGHKLDDARAEPVADFTGAPGYAANWTRCEAALDRLLDGVRAAGISLVVLDHTVPAVPDVARWCAEHDVPCADFRFTDEEWARGVTNSVADKHANALGNELLAEKALPPILDALR